MLNSTYGAIATVQLPYAGRRKYMHTFHTNNCEMATGFEDYRSIVSHLVDMAGYRGIAHMTVDEQVIPAGRSQRRPGAHVDGRFTGDRWGHQPGWLHYCNNIPHAAIPRMRVIVAASVPGCVVYPGLFEGVPKEDGDLEHLRSQFSETVLLPANMGFLLSADCVHESVIFDKPTQRTFLRIALDQ